MVEAVASIEAVKPRNFDEITYENLQVPGWVTLEHVARKHWLVINQEYNSPQTQFAFEVKKTSPRPNPENRVNFIIANKEGSLTVPFPDVRWFWVGNLKTEENEGNAIFFSSVNNKSLILFENGSWESKGLETVFKIK